MLTDADVYEYTDGVDRSGIMGYLRSCIDTYKKPPVVKIVGEEPDWAAYDRVVVGMPVWAEAPCIIGKAFLQQYSSKFHCDLYLVVTHMASVDYAKKIRKLYDDCAVKPKGYLSVQTKKHDPDKEIRNFVKSME
jgi:hypothetical protein